MKQMTLHHARHTSPGISRKCVLAALLLLAGLSATIKAQPKPGDVYREITFRVDSRHISELDPDTPRQWPEGDSFHNFQTRRSRPLDLDLLGVRRAELSLEYWGGHIGTTEQKFRVNGNDWIYIPQPAGMEGDPQCYYRTILGNSSVEIPLEHLKSGLNEFVFTAGPQSCYNFDWGFYWIYSFTVRLYYDSEQDHPSAQFANLAPGDTLSELPTLRAIVNPGAHRVRQVDFIGQYDDFDWDGNGVFREWQYATDQGRIVRHIGTTTDEPHAVRWNTDWIPDQDLPINLALKITDETGLTYLTPALENVRFQRRGWTVKMYDSDDVPERFAARNGGESLCTIEIEDDLAQARAARLVLSTWSAKTDDGARHEIRLNGRLLASNFGRFHDHSYDELNVPIDFLKAGINTISIHSDFKGHALEVNWPGPVLIVQYAPQEGGSHD